MSFTLHAPLPLSSCSRPTENSRSVGRDYDSLWAAKKAEEMTARDRIVEQLLGHFEITDDKDRALAEVHFGDLLPAMKG